MHVCSNIKGTIHESQSKYLKLLDKAIGRKLTKLDKSKQINEESPFIVILSDAIEQSLPSYIDEVHV